jgi:hypothetical protein
MEIADIESRLKQKRFVLDERRGEVVKIPIIFLRDKLEHLEIGQET